MLWDLGLNSTKMEDVEAVEKKIVELDKQFDLGKLFATIIFNKKVFRKFFTSF